MAPENLNSGLSDSRLHALDVYVMCLCNKFLINVADNLGIYTNELV